MPHVQRDRLNAARGATATITGLGFGAAEPVVVTWDCGSPGCISSTVLGSATATANGVFNNLSVTIPTTATLGAHTIGGKGATSGAFAATSYDVTS